MGLVMVALAERAIACKGWRWMPGMLTTDGDRVWAVSEDIDGPGQWLWYDNDIEDGHPEGRKLPDLTDPATLGCLLALAREAWGNPYMTTDHTRWWGLPGADQLTPWRGPRVWTCKSETAFLSAFITEGHQGPLPDQCPGPHRGASNSDMVQHGVGASRRTPTGKTEAEALVAALECAP